MAELRDFTFRDAYGISGCQIDFVQRDNGPLVDAVPQPASAYEYRDAPYQIEPYSCGEDEFDWWVTPDGDAWSTPDGDTWQAIPDP